MEHFVGLTMEGMEAMENSARLTMEDLEVR
jgi:hypothetical protein